jgi:hypothetical protein
MVIAEEIQYRFPKGKPKALVMSYDDGSEHDRRLVELFNRFGIRGSFHLNSGKLGDVHHVSPDEVGLLYQGHEVSCHTVSHPDLTRLSSEKIRRELLDDKAALEKISGNPVRGLAYPFGRYDARIISMLPELGIEYARTTISTNDFSIPDNRLIWETTCHHNLAMDIGRLFLDMDDKRTRLMYVWGHSYELDGFMTTDESKNWQYMERFCQRMYDSPQIHCATTIEIVDYLNAVKTLRFSAGKPAVDNASEITVWLNMRGTTVAIPPGENVDLST